MSERPLKICELTTRCGVSPHTLRFYERTRLLPRALRTASRYRVHGSEDESRLLFAAVVATAATACCAGPVLAPLIVAVLLLLRP